VSFSKIYSRGKQNSNPPVFFSIPFWNILILFHFISSHKKKITNLITNNFLPFHSFPSFFSPLNISTTLVSSSLSLSLSHQTFFHYLFFFLLTLSLSLFAKQYCYDSFFFFNLTFSLCLSPILFLFIFSSNFLSYFLFKSYSTRFSS
jgi:hypothetical protein